ncbi:MAG: hypothetical protein WAN27_16270 [Xanthobacteraceae bacterium]
MGLLTFALNVTLDGCCDHREMVDDDEMLRYWTRVMDAAGAMLFGRRTYELMEDAWPQVARDPKATPSNQDWAKKLEAKPKYVVSTTRRDFPWSIARGDCDGHRRRLAWTWSLVLRKGAFLECPLLLIRTSASAPLDNVRSKWRDVIEAANISLN